MATLISLQRLQEYDTLIKKYSDDGDAIVKAIADKGIKTVTLSGKTLKFYTVSEPTGETAPVYTLTIPETDLTEVTNAISGINTKIGTVAEGDTLVGMIADAKKAGTDAQADVDALEGIVGKASTDTEDATGIIAQIEALEEAVGEGGAVADQIKDAIEALDSEKSSAEVETGKGIKVTVKEVDGKIDTVTVAGDFSNTYDAIGAAAAVQGDTTETVEGLEDRLDGLGTASAADVATTEIGAEGEATDALPTVAQVKKYVTDSVADLEGATHFIGKKESLPATANDGDICIVGVKEYIYASADGWVELGDETIYATKATTIAGVDLQNDITKDELNTALGTVDIVKANAKDGVYKAAVPESSDGAGDGQAAVTIAEAIKANADAIAALDINGDIDAKINALDATKEQTAGADGLALKIVEEDGKITSIEGSIAAETYDAYGSASTAKSEVIGASTDAKTADTIYGAKAYAKDLADSLDYREATADEITAMFATAE